MVDETKDEQNAIEVGEEVREIPDTFADSSVARALVTRLDGIECIASTDLGKMLLIEGIGPRIGERFRAGKSFLVEVGGALGGSSGFLTSGQSLKMCTTL